MKGFLSQRKIAFEVRDVTADESAQSELMDMGFTAIPVTVISGQKPILGANSKMLEEALKKAGLV